MLRVLVFLYCYLLVNQCDAATVYFKSIGGIVDTPRFYYELSCFRDEVPMPFIKLREAVENAGYKVGFCDDEGRNLLTGGPLQDVAAIFSLNEANNSFVYTLSPQYKDRMLMMVTEPPVVMPSLHNRDIAKYFRKVFTLFDEEEDHVQFFKYYFPQARMEMMDGIPDYADKKFCTLINCNKDYQGHPNALYPERRKVIQFLTQMTNEFDLYGGYWDGYPAWKGAPEAKWEVLKNYKFTICYENMGNQKGYITEKIFDSFIAGCVPVYLGANNITDYVPKECFIDRRVFDSDQEMYDFLRCVDRETYQGYITAIKTFLKSPKARLFSKEHFVEFFMNEIKQICPL